MKNPLILILFLFLFLFLFLPQSGTVFGQHVFYGERLAETQETAIYFDKDGFPYPDYYISDSSMVKAYGSLFTWLMQNNEAFLELSARYQLFPEKINRETIFQLGDSITAGIARDLNRKAKDYAAVAFYIHGFRKSFVQQNQDVTSAEEFRLLKTDLLRYHPQQAMEVSVYWDGMYDCCFSKNRKRNKELFLLYEEAAKNARAAGLGFRKILLHIEKDNIQILAHSLGARVATAALFNDPPPINAAPALTPFQQNIRICLLAPAIDRSVFTGYYNRHAPVDYKTKDNYHLMVVYNEKDFVLKKKDPKTGLLGPGPKRYGRTTLGCNWHKEAEKLKRDFEERFPSSTIVLEDKSNIGKCHSLRCYTKEDHLKTVSNFLWGN